MNTHEDTPEGMRENRSFVIRAARMSPRRKVAVEQLGPRWCVEPPAEDPHGRLVWETVFPHRVDEPHRRLVVDIGFGMGRELGELAEARRDTDFLGIEVHPPGVGRMLLEIEERRLTNVRIARHDAVVVLQEWVPPRSVSAIHIFFPDPWPKKRHHKRRLVRRGFPELAASVLDSRGEVYLVTDWEDYAHQMRRVFDNSPEMTNVFPGFAPRQPWRPETAFERKGLARGHTIYELLYRRTMVD